jgi:xylulokinase
MLLLGIDVGTSGSRAVLIDQSGRIVSSATVPHEPFASPEIGWAEQDPADWWRASSAAIRLVLSNDNVRAEEIAGVGLSGQMHGAVLLDQRGEVLRPALIWCDQRSAAQCEHLTNSIGRRSVDQAHLQPRFDGFHFAEDVMGSRKRT